MDLGSARALSKQPDQSTLLSTLNWTANIIGESDYSHGRTKTSDTSSVTPNHVKTNIETRKNIFHNPDTRRPRQRRAPPPAYRPLMAHSSSCRRFAHYPNQHPHDLESDSTPSSGSTTRWPACTQGYRQGYQEDHQGMHRNGQSLEKGCDVLSSWKR